jgi:anti-sigma regulatory factor (Ser/Thr protein kinase)
MQPPAGPSQNLISLQIPPQYLYLRIVRHAIADVCVHAGLSEFKTAELEMAVDEACSRIVETFCRATAIRGDVPPGLRVTLARRGPNIVVEIHDSGPGLSLGSEHAVAPEQYAEHPDQHGLGLYVIKRFVDDFHYEPGTPQGNYMRLGKAL